VERLANQGDGEGRFLYWGMQAPPIRLKGTGARKTGNGMGLNKLFNQWGEEWSAWAQGYRRGECPVYQNVHITVA